MVHDQKHTQIHDEEGGELSIAGKKVIESSGNESKQEDSGNDTIHDATPPHVRGAQSVSGTMPDPESDDDTLQNAHDVGLVMKEDEEHPQPVDIASDVDTAEKSHRTQ